MDERAGRLDVPAVEQIAANAVDKEQNIGENGLTSGRRPQERVELDFFTAEGVPAQLPAVCEADQPAGPERHPLRARPLTVGVDWKVIQYRLPFSERADHRAARDRLETEADIGLAVKRAYEKAPYYPLFAQFGGCHLDVREPFVLYEAVRGKPLAALAGRAGVKEQKQIRGQLVLAVRLLAAIGVVHRGITPYTVLWDGKHVRLPEPYTATRTGHPRQALGEGPWASPEQREGRGEAEPGDDLWSVAQVVYHLITGREGDPAGPPRDLARLPALQVLDTAYEPLARDRPDPVEVLPRLNRSDPLLDRPLPPDPLDEGRRLFDAELARKRSGSGLDFEERTDGEPVEYAPPRGRRAWFGTGRTKRRERR